MDQFRMILAIVLSCIVFLGYNYFFSDSVNQNVTPPETNRIEEKPTEKQIVAAERKTEEREAVKPVISPTVEKAPARTITVQTPLYTLKINTLGAVVSRYWLKEYRETIEKESPDKDLIAKENATGTLHLGMAKNTITGLSDAVFKAENVSDHINLTEQPIEIPFTWVSEKGVVIEKRFRFSPKSYLYSLEVTVSNQSESQIQDGITLTLSNPAPKGATQVGFVGPSALVNTKLEQIDVDKIKEKNLYSGKIGWIALLDRYFLTSIVPKTDSDVTMQLGLKNDNLMEATWIQAQTALLPGQKNTVAFDVYFGPNKISILKSFDNGLERAVDFGWFDFIARPCLWIMNAIHQLIPNYGIAIIILTIVIKILLWPLGQKSYKSMNQMKRMQPLMTEIREKYKNDKKRMNEEMMGLYRTYKVNPLGGCLPMVAQIPVFFAFYRMLYDAVELRHAPFFGWINDLSAPDRLFHFNISQIPFMDPPYGIPVLTIIMGATMFIQQKMQPPMGDPTQAKMMMFMPIIFTVIFINFSSGLVLYWLVNNILSIAQQYFVGKTKA